MAKYTRKERELKNPGKGFRRSIKWRMCYSKVRFYDEYRAGYAVKRILAGGGPEMYSYWCPVCEGFHLTSHVYALGDVG